MPLFYEEIAVYLLGFGQRNWARFTHPSYMRMMPGNVFPTNIPIFIFK